MTKGKQPRQAALPQEADNSEERSRRENGKNGPGCGTLCTLWKFYTWGRFLKGRLLPGRDPICYSSLSADIKKGRGRDLFKPLSIHAFIARISFMLEFSINSFFSSSDKSEILEPFFFA